MNITEPLINDIISQIHKAVAEETACGRQLKSFAVTLDQYVELENAYKNQFGGLLMMQCEENGLGLAIRGVAVYPISNDQ